MQIDFYLSAASRYSYLASTQIERIAALHGCTFAWKPLNNHDLLVRSGADPFRAATRPSGQYDWDYREYDAKCWAEYYGVPFVEPVHFRKDPPFIVRACYAAEACGELVAFCRRISRAIFVQSRVLDEEVVRQLAGEVGIPRGDFERALAAPSTAAREASILEEAVGRGVFGVPTFMLGDRLFWGNDRLVLLEHALARASGVNDSPR